MEDKLEEQEEGRRHLSGFYVQRGYEALAGGRRRPYIILVRPWGVLGGAE